MVPFVLTTSRKAHWPFIWYIFSLWTLCHDCMFSQDEAWKNMQCLVQFSLKFAGCLSTLATKTLLFVLLQNKKFQRKQSHLLVVSTVLQNFAQLYTYMKLSHTMILYNHVYMTPKFYFKKKVIHDHNSYNKFILASVLLWGYIFDWFTLRR